MNELRLRIRQFGPTANLLWLVTGSAAAQVAPSEPTPEAAPPAAPGVAAPPAAPGVAAPPAAPGVAAPPAECIPSCRSGFLCVRGQCVSPCNPGCNANEVCTAARECIRAEDAPKTRPPGYRRHDGFYLRMGFGGGVVGLTLVSDDVDLKGTGVGLAGELACGYSPLAGVALGLGYYFAVATETLAKGQQSGPGFTRSYDDAPSGTASVHLFGPFADVYPWPNRGLHFLAAAGLGPLTWNHREQSAGLATTRVPEDSYSGSGGGFLLGAGYEGWVGAQWSLGGLLRVQYTSGSVNAQPDELSGSRKDGPDVPAEGLGVGVIFTATLH
jgi:hypothetical protein